MKPARALLETIARASLRSVDAEAAVVRALASRAPPRRGRLFVFAAGKAAAPMARAAEDWAGARLAGGLVVTKDGHGLALRSLTLCEAAHPVPDERSEAAGREVLRRVGMLTAADEALVLLSGGASALLSTPAAGITREDLALVTEALLAGGASIDEFNAVRKHLGRVGGGQLAAACPARRIRVLAVSDVPGNRLDVIGSGPCAPDPTTFAQALEVLSRRARGRVPGAVRERLRAGARGEIEETPGAGDACFAGVSHEVVADNARARRASVQEARRLGIHAVDAGEILSGEARDAGRRFAALGSALGSAPALLVAGGETTVTLRGTGRGGRNQELALAAALSLGRKLSLLALGSDGGDGPTPAAGAFVDADTVAEGRSRGAIAAEALANNDSYAFFARQGGLLETGPTGTNVMDLLFLLRSR